MTERLAPAALMAAVALAGGLSAQEQWPMFQADAAHTAYVPITIDPATTQMRWSVRLDSGALTQVSSGAGRVFVSSSAKNLYALDASTGQTLWTKTFGSIFSVNPPSYANGNVYLQTCNNAGATWLHCFDAATGAVVFQSPFGAQWERYMAPTIVDGVVYMNGGTFGGMYAFNGTTGEQKWFRSLPQEDGWTPAVDATHCYMFANNTLYAVDRKSGSQSYTINVPGGSFSFGGLTPMLGGAGDAFVIDGGDLHRFDLALRELTWTRTSRFSGQPALRSGRIYALAAGDLEVRDQTTGALAWLWEHPTGSLSGSVAVTDSHAVVSSSSTVHLIDLGSRSQDWSYPSGGQISMTQEGLFVGQSDGTLTAIEFGPRPDLQSVSPDYANYTQSVPLVTIRGSAFQRGGSVNVDFGGQAAGNITVVDDNTVTCTPPALGPGLVDVQVRTSFGRGTLGDGFAYVPAVRVDGQAFTGRPLNLTYHCEPGDQIVALLGIAPRTSLPVPPFAGQLEIAPPIIWLFVPGWPFTQFPATLNIPPDPSLRGVQVLFQGLIGPGVVSAFSNTEEVTIR